MQHSKQSPPRIHQALLTLNGLTYLALLSTVWLLSMSTTHDAFIANSETSRTNHKHNTDKINDLR